VSRSSVSVSVPSLMPVNQHEQNMVRRGLARRRPSHIILGAVVVFLFFVLQKTLSVDSDAPHHPKYHEPLHFKASSVDWVGSHLFFPPESISPLPTGHPKGLPQVQAAEKLFRDTQVTRDRRQAVKNVFSRSWDAYKDQAWTWDEVHPVTGGGKNTFGGWAATLVDSLDTLWIMGYVKSDYSMILTMANSQNILAIVYMTTSMKHHRSRLNLTGRIPRRPPPIFLRPLSDIWVVFLAHMISVGRMLCC